jgi:hypothetical protein
MPKIFITNFLWSHDMKMSPSSPFDSGHLTRCTVFHPSIIRDHAKLVYINNTRFSHLESSNLYSLNLCFHFRVNFTDMFSSFVFVFVYPIKFLHQHEKMEAKIAWFEFGNHATYRVYAETFYDNGIIEVRNKHKNLETLTNRYNFWIVSHMHTNNLSIWVQLDIKSPSSITADYFIINQWILHRTQIINYGYIRYGYIKHRYISI